MPLYVYKCEECGHEFEEIVPYFKRDDPRDCSVCGKGSKRVEVTSFGISVKADKGATIVSPKEIDKAVGVDAEKRWNWLETRKNKRHEGWKRGGLKTFQVQGKVGEDGKFKPAGTLGDSKERVLRKEYSEALAEHRSERKRKGEAQFDAPGAITE